MSLFIQGPVTWGSISGSILSQPDLVTALNNEYDASNPSGFIGDAPADGTQYARQDNSWVTASGGGGGGLPLSGGTMTGNITFGTGSQYIGAGTFDTGRGGSNGLSLVCAVGYEFNWQAGWLITTEQNSATPRPLYLDSGAGTTLRSWDSSTDTGTKVAHTGINIGNTSVYYVDVTPDALKVFESTNELGVTIAHDSIAIQHIDTPNVTAYFTNEYIGFEDLSGTPHSTYIEHDVITVQDATETTQIHSTGVSLSTGGSITFGDSTTQSTAGIPEAPIDGTMYGRVLGAWIPIPEVASFTTFANDVTGPNGIGSWLCTGSNMYLGSTGNVIFDNYSGVTSLTINSGTSAGTNYSFNLLPNITNLEIYYTSATATLHFDYGIYPSLTNLNISYNSGFALPPVLNSNLTSIAINDNTAMTSPPDFSNLGTNAYVQCGGNTAMTNAPTFAGSTVLSVYCDGNTAMTNAPDFTNCHNLSSLSVSGNSNMTNPPTLTGCGYLYSLQCNNNSSMTTAPVLPTVGEGGNAGIHNVEIAYNGNITTAPVVLGLPDITNLYLNDNAISDCTTVIDSLDTNGLSNGYLQIAGGNNQAIDPTYASLTSLQGKGWTVVFNSI